MTADLSTLGDQLEAAIRRDLAVTAVALRRRTRRRRASIAALGAVMAAGVGVGTAAATGAFSSSAVEKGMPAGATIFAGTHPHCTTTDDITFDCNVTPQRVPMVSDFTGTKEALDDETQHVIGGCVGLDAAGAHWRCYVGQRAVDEGTLDQPMLGAYAPGPRAG